MCGVACAHRDEGDAKENLDRRTEMDTFVSNVCIYATNIVRVFLCESHMDGVERKDRINHTFLDELSQSQRVLNFIWICEISVFWQTMRCERKGIKIIYSRRDSVTWNESCTYCENLKLSTKKSGRAGSRRIRVISSESMELLVKGQGTQTGLLNHALVEGSGRVASWDLMKNRDRAGH